ncbi:hypothetical protein BH10CYA1_BH10CYA1_60490 [soil metagenome]
MVEKNRTDTDSAIKRSSNSRQQSSLENIWKECACPPQPCAQLCQTLGVSGGKHVFLKNKNKTSIVAYVRVDDKQLPQDEQIRIIKSYCALHDLDIAHTFIDHGKPSYGLQDALQELENSDALISVDLNVFVEHEGDRVRDLRPLIHHFFCHQKKHLIAIQEGLDTGTAAGQRIAMDIASEVKDSF